MFKIYRDKKILVTGHTGFKGSWLISWLKLIGADVVGISLPNENDESLFASTGIKNAIHDYRLDIRDADQLSKIIQDEKPDFIFHLAAQALVRKSYIDPLLTWSTNLMGTVNVLDSLRKLDKKCPVIIITSDKCYDNVEWVWGYREHDRLGGPDPYSASKGSAELAINSYVKSFFNEATNISICSARAGNVIGGGDWSDDRIIPDCVKAWSKNQKVILRNPHSTRPWQHVLEPISGYLRLGNSLYKDNKLHGEAFNFGPNTNEDQSVLDIVKKMSEFWDDVIWDTENDTQNFYESGLLKLNCDKARSMLDWHAVLGFDQTMKFTAEWYKEYYNNSNMYEYTKQQIKDYISFAKSQNIKWIDE